MRLTPKTVRYAATGRMNPIITVTKMGVQFLYNAREIFLKGPVVFEEVSGLDHSDVIEVLVYIHNDGFKLNKQGFISSRYLGKRLMTSLKIAGKTRFELIEDANKKGLFKITKPQQK